MATDQEPVARADVLLNEPQRLRFEVLLELLEQSLNEVERLASLSHESGSSSRLRYDPDIPAAFGVRAAPLIDKLKGEIESLATILEIESRPRSRRNAIRAILTAEMVRVDDAFSYRLGGYGAVSRTVETEIDPRLSAIRLDLRALLDELDPDS